MSTPKAAFPGDDEVAAADLRWEYAQDIIDVSTFEDPPGSREPIINIRRRIVGGWEPVDG